MLLGSIKAPGISQPYKSLPNHREMQSRSHNGGFEFMPRPSDKYYRGLPAKIGDALNAEQYRMLEEMGILADRDDQGVLLQIFTKPLGGRS